MYYVSVFMIMIFIGGVLIVLRMLAGTPQIDELEDLHAQNSVANVDDLLSQVKNNHVKPGGKEQLTTKKV